MKIRNVVHGGLRRFVEKDKASGLPAAAVEKIRDILSYLQDMANARELRRSPSWKTHQLTGIRKGTWSMAVTRDWRITFRIDEAEGEIGDLNFEDCH